MKILVDKKEFLTKFKLAASAACLNKDADNQLVKIVADEHVSLHAVHSDTDPIALAKCTSLRLVLSDDAVSIKQPGECLVPAKMFTETLTAIKAKQIQICTTKTSVTLGSDSAGAEMTIAVPDTKSADNFPTVTGIDCVKCHTMSAADLQRAIKRTIFAADKVPSYNTLNGICFESEGDLVHAVATTGMQMAWQVIGAKQVKKHEFGQCEPDMLKSNPDSVVLSLKAAGLLERILRDSCKPDDEVRMSFIKDKNVLQYKTKDMLLVVNLTKSNFYRWRVIVPKQSRADAIVENYELAAMLQQIRIESGKKKDTIVSMQFALNKLTLLAANADKKTARSVPIRCQGTAKIPVRLDDLLDCLSALDGKYNLALSLPGPSVTKEKDGSKRVKIVPVIITTSDGYSYYIVPACNDSPDFIPYQYDTHQKKKNAKRS